MTITKRIVANKLASYLRQELTLDGLVAWSESAMQGGVLEEEDIELLAGVVGRLGVADVRAFGLTWDDCEELLKQLGYSVDRDHLWLEMAP
jgi:hypothetical protein